MDALKQRVEQAVNEIFKRDGQVRPSTLVEEARPASSPIHTAFEWDDQKAGSEYRLLQARQWIKRVEIIIDDRRETLVHVPAVNMEPDALPGSGREGYYKPVSVVMHSEDEYDRAVKEALARLNAAKASYETLKTVDRKGKVNTRRADRGFSMVESALQRAV